jgi:hypothetical protein
MKIDKPVDLFGPRGEPGSQVVKRGLALESPRGPCEDGLGS